MVFCHDGVFIKILTVIKRNTCYVTRGLTFVELKILSVSLARNKSVTWCPFVDFSV